MALYNKKCSNFVRRFGKERLNREILAAWK